MNEEKDSLNVLAGLLNYVKNNVPYYENVQGPELSNFSVISKRVIMDNYEHFKSREYKDTELHWVSTSGSTGIPFKAGQNSEKRNRTIADLLYFINSMDGI